MVVPEPPAAFDPFSGPVFRIGSKVPPQSCPTPEKVKTDEGSAETPKQPEKQPAAPDYLVVDDYLPGRLVFPKSYKPAGKK